MSDLIERAKKLLTECGPHDHGLVGFACGCSGLDHRPVVSELLAYIAAVKPVLDAAQARADVLRDGELYGSGSIGWYGRARESDEAIRRTVDAFRQAVQS